MGEWSELPQELLRLIARRIDNCFDLIHFRSVCSTWRSSAPPRLRHLPLQCPLPPDQHGFGDDCHISKRCVYLLKSTSGDRSQYWLLKLQEKENGELILRNLFDGRCSAEYKSEYPRVSLDLLNCQVTALEQEHFGCYTEWIEAFEWDFKTEERVGFEQLGLGKEEGFAVIGTLSFKSLVMYRSVDKRWKVLDPTQRHFQATASFNRKFYGVDFSGTTTVVKPSLEVCSFQNSKSRAPTTKRWLVRSGKELILVELWMENAAYGPLGEWYKPERREKIRVEVSKLEEERDEWEDGEVGDIGGHVVFLGSLSSFSCLASEIPGFKGNSIFFMEFWGESLDPNDLYDRILVFEFAQRSVRSVREIPRYVELFQSPPGWVISNH